MKALEKICLESSVTQCFENAAILCDLVLARILDPFCFHVLKLSVLPDPKRYIGPSQPVSFKYLVYKLLIVHLTEHGIGKLATSHLF